MLVTYGHGLDIEWTRWELLKIQEIKDRRNIRPIKNGSIRCDWPGCGRSRTRDSNVCWKHRKLMRALGGFVRDY